MQKLGNLPGFRHLYRTTRSDAAVVRSPAAGITGVLGKKNEWVIRRGDSESISLCQTEMFLQSPQWAAERGFVDDVMAEIERFAYPEIYECM